MRRPALLAPALLIPALLAGCGQRKDVGPVVVSVIGDPPRLADPSRTALTASDRALIDATAQGLVRFDAAGQIEPGLAERWTVIDGGMSYIFRLRTATWPDGKRVTAPDVATILRRQLAPGSRNPLAPYLSAIEDVVGMTPEVLEVRLSRPRPDLLKLFAQPELAVLRAHPPGGSGPLRRLATGLLAPVPELDRSPDETDTPTPEDSVRLIGERAARAISRFHEQQSDLVLGGSVADWPLTRTVELAPANVRLDPAAGLFGLAVASRTGFLADAANRLAVAEAIDRAALTAAFAPEWPPADQLLPEQLDSGASPAAPAWRALSLNDRRDEARARVAAWQRANGPAVLRLALPKGSGGTLLWGRLAADLREIGIEASRVAPSAPADLRLIDAVAPFDSARWYLLAACQPCSTEANAAIEAARVAPTLAARAQALAKADTALAADGAFITLARPFRWSLVALRLKAWQPNPRAAHPLNRLRPAPN